MKHESIFLKVKKYYSDPITEYKKISSFIKNKDCYYHNYSWTVFDVFDHSFMFSESLRGVYASLSDCLKLNIEKLDSYKNVSDFSSLEQNLQDDLVDEFLTYCEILVCMYKLGAKNILVKDSHNIEGKGYLQTLEMIQISLKSMNYKIINLDSYDNEEVEIIKINPVAEYVAEESAESIGKAIIIYLGARDSDLKEKENRLHNLIDLLEPLLSKYSSHDRIGKVKQFVQLIRHPEQYKAKKEYFWFFENKTKYLDYIFDMCIYVQQYAVLSEHIIEFDKLSIVENDKN